MIALHLYVAFIVATTILMLIPGPNVALIVANSVGHGTRYGLLTVAGTSAAILVHMVLTVIGLAALLGSLGAWFEWVRWIGVAYLLWLGIRQWRAPVADLAQAQPQPRSERTIFLRGFVVSLTNPKTLFFYGAFFPQFLSPGQRPGELLVLAATFLALTVILDSLWAMLAGRVRFVLARHGKLRNRLSGGLLIGAGLGLAAARHR